MRQVWGLEPNSFQVKVVNASTNGGAPWSATLRVLAWGEWENGQNWLDAAYWDLALPAGGTDTVTREKTFAVADIGLQGRFRAQVLTPANVWVAEAEQPIQVIRRLQYDAAGRADVLFPYLRYGTWNRSTGVPTELAHWVSGLVYYYDVISGWFGLEKWASDGQWHGIPGVPTFNTFEPGRTYSFIRADPAWILF